MGFWGTLGKVAGIAGPLAAAPFTGGTSLLGMLGMGAKTAGMIGAGLGTAGRLASGASAQRAQDRGAQADYNLLRQQVENQRVGNENTNAMALARDRRSAEADRLRQLGSVDMLSGMKPPTDPRARFDTGGRMSPEHLAMVRERAMKALESGSDVPQLQTSGPTPTMPRGTGTDSFLNALSMGGTVLGGMREAGLFGGSQPAPGGVDLDKISGVGRVAEDERPWWLKQEVATMPYQYGKVNL